MNTKTTTYRICTVGIIAAAIFLVNYLTPIPFLGTKLRFSNALCALGGLLLGPVSGFLAAGVGSALYDLTAGYAPLEMGITFISKGAIALLAGLIAYRVNAKAELSRTDSALIAAGCVAGALANVVLYMLKTFLFGLYVKGFTMDATLVSMGTKLPGSLLNAAFAIIVAPILYHALRKPLRHLGVIGKA